MRFFVQNQKLNFLSHIFLIIFSFYLSTIIFFGSLLGYAAAKYISKKAAYGSKIRIGYLRLVRLKFRNFRFYFHHWLQAIIVLGIYILFFGGGNPFVIGFLSGVIAEDFLCDDNFYKIFERAESAGA